MSSCKKGYISDYSLPWLMPLLIVLLAFTVYPIFYNIYLSFHEFAPRKRALEFVGFENWSKLFEDTRLWFSLLITFVFFTIALIIEAVLGMFIALLLDSDDKGYGFFRSLMTLTLVIPMSITGMIFVLLEDGEFGALTFYLVKLGLLEQGTSMLSNSSLALAGVMIAEIWQWTSFMVLIFLAGLRALPKEPFEAALLAGAKPWTIFRRLTLPMMKKVIIVAMLIRGIDLLRMFDYVYVMTSGGPGISTYTISLYSWQQTFSFIKWGYGATISLFTLVIILTIFNILLKVFKVRL